MFCAKHKKKGMVNVYKTCNHPDCNKRPIFNNPEEKTYVLCRTQKKEGMVDVKNKTCNNEWCNTQVTKI